MKIIFDPSNSRTNKYVVILTNLLDKNGVKIHSFSEAFANFKIFKEIRIVHLNWFENLVGKTNFAITLNFLKKILKLTILKVTGKKIVWTMHNRMPHDQQMLFLKRILIYYLLKSSDKVVIHSKSSKEILRSLNFDILSKVIYIPHPDYINAYGLKSMTVPKDNSTALKLLFLGAVKPYKNIEIMLDVMKSFGKNVELTIAGNPANHEYRGKLAQYATHSSNVKLELKFIPDEDIPQYIEQCDLLILPYDITSSLNSGTAILAFSYGKTVICPEIGTILDYEHEGSILTYRYNNQDEHREALYKVIRVASDMKKEDPDIFKALGHKMLLLTEKLNNKEMVAFRLENLYKELA